MTASKTGANSAIGPSQIRAARALLDWSRDVLACASGVPKRTLVRLEAGEVLPQQRTVSAVRTALESAGVEFIEENGGGPGVRLRKGVAATDTTTRDPTNDPTAPAVHQQQGSTPGAAGRPGVGPEDEDRAGPGAPSDGPGSDSRKGME